MANSNDVDGSYKWETLKPMPTKRVFSTPVEASNGHLFVIGGCDQMGTPIDAFESYDPKKGKWMRLLQMPTKRAGTCAVAVGNKIVAMGGVAVDQKPLDVVEAYDISSKKWETKESLKEHLLGLSAVVRDGKILVIGGMGLDTNPKDYLMGYDIETNLWESFPKMPTPRYATFSFLINDKLYVLGGRQGKIPVVAFEVFDFAENKWRKLPDIPSKRVFALYTHSDKHIYSIGGLNQNPKDGFSDATEVFDLETETWKIGKPMPTKRGDFAIGFLGDKVVAAGGLGNQGKPLHEVDVYDQASDSWTSIHNLPTSHCSCAYIKFQDRMHVIGGLSQGGPSCAMEGLSFKS